MPYMLNGRRLRVGRPFVHTDGRQFGSNWTKYTTDEKTALGITYEADPEPFDSKYYYSAGNPRPVADVPQVDEDGNPVLDTDGNQVIQTGLKTNFTAEQKTIAGQLLSSTDWYVVRKSEVGTAIPNNVTTYRAAVRTVCDTREAEITVAGSTEELEYIIKNNLTPWPEL